MLKNEQLQQEFDLFADVWKLFKYAQPVGSRTDVKYWDFLNKKIIEIMEKYPGEFATELSLTILNELERKGNLYEDKDTGCKAIP